MPKNDTRSAPSGATLTNLDAHVLACGLAKGGRERMMEGAERGWVDAYPSAQVRAIRKRRPALLEPAHCLVDGRCVVRMTEAGRRVASRCVQLWGPRS